MDSCVVCLLSHGVDGAVYGTDAKLLQVCLINLEASLMVELFELDLFSSLDTFSE